MKDLIFENRLLAPLPHRVGWTFFTALFWMVWIYLWMPLATLVLWWLGILAYAEYFGTTVFFELDQLKHTALVYCSVIFVLGGSLLLWARVEFLRFRNVNRRSIPVPVTAEEVATYTGIPVQQIEQWKSARSVVAHHDSHGNVMRAELHV